MSRWNISHTTEIDAPIDKVWSALIDIDDWHWNKWTRLEASEASTGTKGKLKASYEGDDQWETFDFEFGPVSEKEHLLSWQGSVGPKGSLFSGQHHSMQLEAIDKSHTRPVDSSRTVWWVVANAGIRSSLQDS